MIGCLTDTTTCVVAKPLVTFKEEPSEVRLQQIKFIYLFILLYISLSNYLSIRLSKYSSIELRQYYFTSGFATTHVVVSVRPPITY